MIAVWSGPGADAPFSFLALPFVIWAGLRFGARGAAIVVALLTVLAMALAIAGLGPVADLPVPTAQAATFLFLLMAAVTGQVLAAMVAERDDALQKRVQLEELLRHSQKMEAVGRLAGGIAHDFNNLLTAILGYTDIVVHGMDPKDPRRADAEQIERAATRAADLTRQMLAFSRREPQQATVIDLNRLLGKVEPMLRRVIGEDVKLTIAPKATPSVRARGCGADGAGDHEPGRQRPRRDAAGRPAADRDRTTAWWTRAPRPRITKLGQARTSCCRSPTPASACPQRCARGCSSRTSPPRPPAKEPGWGCPPSTAS